MVEENQDKIPPSVFENEPVEEPEREVELPEEEVVGVGTLEKQLALAPNLSDMQVAMLKLFPESFWERVFLSNKSGFPLTSPNIVVKSSINLFLELSTL